MVSEFLCKGIPLEIKPGSTPFYKGKLYVQNIFNTNHIIQRNFHVWNDVFMRRTDLDANGTFDGWQAIDATPQVCEVICHMLQQWGKGDNFVTLLFK